MISEIQALETALAGVVVGGVHVGQHSNPPDQFPKLPYILIEPQVGDPLLEESLEAEDGEWDVDVRLKAVAANTTSALVALRNAKMRLTAGRRRAPLLVPGRSCRITYMRHEVDFVDTQTLIAGTSRQVVLSIDTYRLVSEPN